MEIDRRIDGRTTVRGLLLALAWAARACADAEATPTPANTAASPRPPAALAELIGQLDDGEFAVRERAQSRLAQAGRPALDAVARQAAEGSLESSTRALSILLEWSERDDLEFSTAALERIAGLNRRPVEAGHATERLVAMKETTALRALAQAGAALRFDMQIPGDPRRPPLQVVIGPDWKGGAAGLEALRDVSRLGTLSFHSAPLDEPAYRKARQLTQVKRVEFYGTPVSAEVVADLQQALPQAKIEVRGGARLGISGSIVPGIAGAHVDRVVGAPAIKAGLRPGDVITQLGEVPIKDFEHLTQEIAKRRPDESVPLTVQRQGAPVTLSVTFDRWGTGEPLGADPYAVPGNQDVLPVVIPQPQGVILRAR